ncbi:MAG: hypothetical protein U0905_19650 [Pirellulales bacterium]
MANPYKSSTTSVSEADFAAGIKSWNRRQWLAALASLIAVIVLAIDSLVLITQALRLNSESATLPARLRTDYVATARSSWIGGIAAMAGVLLNAGGLFWIRKNKLIVPTSVVAISVIGLISIAILFKPS